jgi:hypothetical protein
MPQHEGQRFGGETLQLADDFLRRLAASEAPERIELGSRARDVYGCLRRCVCLPRVACGVVLLLRPGPACFLAVVPLVFAPPWKVALRLLPAFGLLPPAIMASSPVGLDPAALIRQRRPDALCVTARDRAVKRLLGQNHEAEFGAVW